MSVKDRVWAAAEAIQHEGGSITVASVRERAACSNADASDHLRAWRRLRQAEPTPRPLPGVLAAMATRQMEAVWEQACAAADRLWEPERKEYAAEMSRAVVESAEQSRRADGLAAELEAATAKVAQLTGLLAAEKEARAAEVDALRQETARMQDRLLEAFRGRPAPRARSSRRAR